MDGQIKQRSSSAEKPRVPASRPEQSPPPEDRRDNQASPDNRSKASSWRERWREHRQLLTVAS